MAGPCRGGSRAPRVAPSGTRDERRSPHGGHALDFTLRALRHHPDIRREHDDYFARQIVFERLAQATLPTGVTPTLAPLFSPSGLVYRYVLESPDRSPQELKTIEDWVVERAYRSVHGVADDSGFGGTVMQYQVLLDPARIYGYHLTVPQVTTALAANNANAGGGFYSQGGQFYYVRGIGLVRNTDDIGNIVVGANKGVPYSSARRGRRHHRARATPRRIRLSEK